MHGACPTLLAMVTAETADGSSFHLEFGILGPLEVRLDGRLLELRRVKERTLLAMLLLRVNQVVSLDHLAAGLWEDWETPRPPATLRVHVSRLRQALAPGEGSADSVLVTSGRGYRLQVPERSRRCLAFRAAGRRGRRHLTDDDPAAASDSFARRRPWRGRLLDDLTLSPAVEPDVARLEEARLSVIEDRVEAELWCGNHHGLVGELEQLVSEYPLRERLWGQWMMALYRCGRQAESLRAYEELRILLRDELGIPPSPFVQDVNQAVLDQDPSWTFAFPSTCRRAPQSRRRHRARVPGRATTTPAKARTTDAASSTTRWRQSRPEACPERFRRTPRPTFGSRADWSCRHRSRSPDVM